MKIKSHVLSWVFSVVAWFIRQWNEREEKITLAFVRACIRFV